ncbi:MAG: 6-bladed beta-propeller [Parvularculaceae bacterium]
MRPTPIHRPNARAGWLARLLGALAAGLGAAACATAPVVEDQGPLVYPPPPELPRFVYERTITGSSDVIVETSADRFRRFATGEQIRGKGFSKPFDIVVRNGRIYVSDTVGRRVHMLDLNEKRYAEIGTKGNGRLAKPLGLALDQAGRLYVCDGTAKRVVIFDSEGEFLGAVGGEDFLERPTGVAVSADGSRIFVVDTGGVWSDNHRVRVFDPKGRHLEDIGTRGADEGEFNLPLTADMGPGETLRVLDTGNFRVQAFSPELKVVNAFGKPGRYAGHFSHAKGIATDADGRIYIADTGFGVVQIFLSDGRVLMSLGSRSETPGAGHFILPAGVSVDLDGRVYVVDQFYSKIDVFRPAFLPEDWPAGSDYHLTPGYSFDAISNNEVLNQINSGQDDDFNGSETGVEEKEVR